MSSASDDISETSCERCVEHTATDSAKRLMASTGRRCMEHTSADGPGTSRSQGRARCMEHTSADFFETGNESDIRKKSIDKEISSEFDEISKTQRERYLRKNRIGTVGIIVDDVAVSDRINEILHQYAYLIVGRLGIPYRSRGVAVISVVVDGTMEDISAMTGRLGKLAGVSVKAAVSKR